MEKIIIKNLSDLPINVAFALVLDVMEMGRVSKNNKQFCYLSIHTINGIEYSVNTELRRRSDVFIISNTYKSK